MSYIKRDIENAFMRMSEQFKVIMVTGPRQVGKTTMLKKIMEGTDRKFVTLDDFAMRQLANNDPESFIKTYTPPVFIDEVQYAPELFSYIKIEVDQRQKPNDYWLSGSQVFSLMRGVRESLAGRVGLLDLFSLSQNEIYNHKECKPLKTDFESIADRTQNIPNTSPIDIYERIFNGGMPELITGDLTQRDVFYQSYIRTYIERDVRDVSGDIDALKFHRFITSVSARCSQLVNYKSIADDAEIDQNTAKNWLNILETLGIIFYLHPYSNNTLKRTIKSPKLYFYDSGLVSYLTRWSSVETLMNGAMDGAILENFVVSEIKKGYHNSGKTPYLTYYRDRDGKEIDVIWEENGTLYPLEIKKTSTPNARLTNVFKVLEKSDKILGQGGIICLKNDFIPLDKNNSVIPIRSI
ncbi:MAG: ATP-binding protein [Oscillospiraceae bacterium]|nr:ATP-binding protein [Oscillospiraceae bacterium]